jgi:hypothetical protein
MRKDRSRDVISGSLEYLDADLQAAIVPNVHSKSDTYAG